jgi:hypothetical protein
VCGKVRLSWRNINLEPLRARFAWHYKQYAREQSESDRRLYAGAEELRIHLKQGSRRFCEKMRAMRTPQLLCVLLIFGLLTGGASAQGVRWVARECARHAVIEQIEKAWATSGTKEPLRLIVIFDKI